jgi:hypothetical protein
MGTRPGATTSPASASSIPAPPPCRDCGTVRSVRERRPSGQGAWADGIGERPLAGLEQRQANPYSRQSDDEVNPNRPNTAVAGAGAARTRPVDEPTRTYTRESASGGLHTTRRETPGIESRSRKRFWEVVIGMEGGSIKVIEYERRPGLQVGDKVKVQGTNVFVR